jgi:16S rRNA (guanine(966)-N(2))-methyltransferase RsmD
MRIVSGKYKGKKIIAGNSLAIRPVTTKIKESIFNILGEYVLEKNIIDLFSGSGSFGLEALSRGAKTITFVEKERNSIRILEKNLTFLHIPPEDYTIIQADVLKFCKKKEHNAELILMDPPFNFLYLQDLIEMIIKNRVLASRGVLVVHHEISNPIQTDNTMYRLFKQRRFGRNLVSIILRKENHA